MLGSTLDLTSYTQRLQAELARVREDQIKTFADLLFEAWQNDKFVYIFGNGGSGCNASHMAEDLGKSTLYEKDLLDESKKRLKVLSLTDNVGWIMAVGNDVSYEQIFQQQLMNYGREGDLVVAISGSGNSKNVLNAVDWANRHGLTTLGITGYSGGQLMTLAQHNLHVPLDDMGMVESIHMCLFHWVLNDVFARINQVGRYAQG
ncbi:sugar isomerase (SIS) [Pirellula staleyi DSM 6068]|uniref:Sugar isomerase (SIS) n=1 Tax=Pirellula staleyi (strain ATCC 27377 / DSM 6068 / ICPB 4128) TaxID=530564 RepID=D2QWU8_PIRSD|nr:SIS domain-containing protein [Pirellula staleyi]ADB16052.1 sugar isomerase (SIS) [Pirellula staleyi DSM 6068]